jgi:hypothetical protein
MGRRREALAVAEEAYQLAADQGRTTDVAEIQLLLDTKNGRAELPLRIPADAPARSFLLGD